MNESVLGSAEGFAKLLQHEDFGLFLQNMAATLSFPPNPTIKLRHTARFLVGFYANHTLLLLNE